jgi:hypothetical protein
MVSTLQQARLQQAGQHSDTRGRALPDMHTLASRLSVAWADKGPVGCLPCMAVGQLMHAVGQG